MTKQPDPAFLALVDTHEETLLRASRLLTGDWDLADELLRDTLSWALVSWKSLARNGLGPLRTRQRLVAAYLISQPPDEPGESATDDAEPERSDPTQPLLAALARLDPVDRATVVAQYYLGLSAAEIGEILGREEADVADAAVEALRELGWPG